MVLQKRYEMEPIETVNDVLNVLVRIAGTTDEKITEESVEIAKNELDEMITLHWEDFERVILAFGVCPTTNRLDGPTIDAALDMENESSPMYKIKNRMDDQQHVVVFDSVLGLCDTLCGGEDLDRLEDSNESIDHGDSVLMLAKLRVSSRLRDLHEILKAYGEYDVAATMEEQMLDILKTRRDAIGENTDTLLKMQMEFRKCKNKSKIELEESRNLVTEQCATSEKFGVDMASIFEERDATHDRHIVLIKDSDTAANVMITMQEKMLGNRKCACLIIDIRSCRSMFYCWFGAFVIFLIVDNILKMQG